MLAGMTGGVELEVVVDGDVVLVAEGFGAEREDVVVLLSGAAMPATMWEDALVASLVEAGIGVIRFDWRDIGRSTWRSFKEHPYSIDTLANDVLAVADAFGVRAFHLVGFSMGGCVAQLVGLAQRDRIRSMALLSSGYASEIDVPRPERGRQLFELFALPRPTSEEEMVDRQVEQWRLLCGPGVPFDVDEWTRRAQAWVARGHNPGCPHVRLGPQVFGVDRERELCSLDIPTLVLHGTDDPMFPLPHGERLAAVLPSASLEIYERRGHDLHLLDELPELVGVHVEQVAG